MWYVVSCGDVNARRCAIVIRKHRRAVGHVGLACSSIGDLEAASFKAFADLLKNGFVVAQRTARQFRDDFPGNVICSRTQAAGDEDNIASGGGFLDRHPNGITVRYSRLLLYSQSQWEKLLGEKREVRVDNAAKRSSVPVFRTSTRVTELMMVREGESTAKSFCAKAVLFVLEDVKKIGQYPDQDQFGMGGLKVILMQNSVLMRQNLCAVAGRQDPSFVEWIK